MQKTNYRTGDRKKEEKKEEEKIPPRFERRARWGESVEWCK